MFYKFAIIYIVRKAYWLCGQFLLFCDIFCAFCDIYKLSGAVLLYTSSIDKTERKYKMEVIIFSQDIGRRSAAMQAADNIIAGKRLRIMSVYPTMPRNADELAQDIKPNKGYLVIMDIIGFPRWKEIIGQITESSHRISFCLVSDSHKAAAEAVNSGQNICGYININEGLNEGLENALVQIYKRIATVCGGIMTSDKSGALKVISFNDIYYIETIKQKHLCTVYHKNGSDIIRADISKLIKNLDGRFEITRSSTIANLSLAEKISDGMIYFVNGDCCSIAAKKVGDVKKAMLEMTVL